MYDFQFFCEFLNFIPFSVPCESKYNFPCRKLLDSSTLPWLMYDEFVKTFIKYSNNFHKTKTFNYVFMWM